MWIFFYILTYIGVIPCILNWTFWSLGLDMNSLIPFWNILGTIWQHKMLCTNIPVKEENKKNSAKQSTLFSIIRLLQLRYRDWKFSGNKEHQIFSKIKSVKIYLYAKNTLMIFGAFFFKMLRVLINFYVCYKRNVYIASTRMN